MFLILQVVTAYFASVNQPLQIINDYQVAANVEIGSFYTLQFSKINMIVDQHAEYSVIFGADFFGNQFINNANLFT